MPSNDGVDVPEAPLEKEEEDAEAWRGLGTTAEDLGVSVALLEYIQEEQASLYNSNLHPNRSRL